MEAIIKVFAAALIIAFTSWLSGKKPELAGFIIALPMVSILAEGRPSFWKNSPKFI